MRVRLVQILLFATTILSCKKDTPVDGGGPPCPPIRILAPAPYSEPIWHPQGNIIGFNYMPLKKITYPYGEQCQGEYEFLNDSIGFWICTQNGDSMQRILPYPLSTPTWSANGEWIAFVANGQVFKMRFTGTRFDTTTLTQLTFDGRSFFPAWSSDGQWIAYDSNAESPNGMNFIWKMKQDGTEKRRIAYEPSEGEIRSPSWSADRTKIVHIRYVVGVPSSEVFVMDTSGMNPIRLTFNNVIDYSPAYSPDGAKIAFWESASAGGIGNIWLMDRGGTNLTKVTTEGVGTAFSWSSDGSQLVYVSFRPTDWTYGNGTIWLIDVNTGVKRQLTRNPHGLNLFGRR